MWKKAPFIRMLVPFMVGVVLQWYFQVQIILVWLLLVVSALVPLAFFILPVFQRYKLALLNGSALSLLFVSLGCLIARQKDIRNDQRWFENNRNNNSCLLVSLSEKPVEKTRSYKANASVDHVLNNDSVLTTKGTVILYFEKDSLPPALDYGSQMIISKSFQEIKNSGNPGGFDYKRYCLFQGITHQVFLKETDYSIVSTVKKNVLHQFINNSREKVLTILRRNIKGEKELGLAEALLIGYKNDLDKTLVQSYSNTGVVHVIAISGLHLGLVYWVLTWIFKPLQKRRLRWLRPVFILAVLWLFSLLAGAQPSVLRSAVMFSCIILGDYLHKQSSIVNSLALSALLLLCINPYWLWDVGFQLSYAAVVSIVTFMQPIYHWFYIRNKIMDLVWKLNAVTIAAQILTVPVGLYHFHQFPANFLFTNILAVPLSSLILFGEIVLCILSFVPAVALLLGKVLSWLIWLMNSYIEEIEKLPFALWEGFQISFVQAVLLVAVVVGWGDWLMNKNKKAFKYAMIAALGFFALRTMSFVKARKQHRLIVYNVPQKQAIDIIDGRKYLFIGDSDLLGNNFITNFHIKPSRIFHRLNPSTRGSYHQDANLLFYERKKVMIMNQTKYFLPTENKIDLDLLIISGNINVHLNRLVETFTVKQVVFDSKCPAAKVHYWKKDCEAFHIPCYDVKEKGALVMPL